MDGGEHYAIIILLVIIILILWWRCDNSKPRITLYYLPKCPWCEKIKPYWDEAKKKYSGVLKFKEHNEEFNASVPSVPAIIMEHGDHTHKYDHQYEKGHLESWLTQTLRIPPM